MVYTFISFSLAKWEKTTYNDAAIRDVSGGITTRALRFIPLLDIGGPCMRIEICSSKLR